KLKKDAEILQEAGVFSLVLEKIPAQLASEVSKLLKIPVIGIGAGRDTDGQVLVLHDMLGITQEFSPRFLRRYANLYETVTMAVAHYISDVKKEDFPNEKEEY
ncbi:MAG TPA: 3-methyl-2-oxobutanoate hydroxymethyltransferase, partial [Bacteroidales bacterium]|nr:3-methyl-2-oxobutanoate hydroxymethyltransferase [Bacteroidales bacterium]